MKIVTQDDIKTSLEQSKVIARGRSQILLHDSFDEIPQRFINNLQEFSYVRPHMHVVPNQWEMMVLLYGEIKAIIFDDVGTVTKKIIMNQTQSKVIQIPPFIYHSFVAVGEGSYLEIRNCRYQPSVDRVYATWSPEEGGERAFEYQRTLALVEVGDKIILD